MVDFPNHKKSKDGKMAECKDCHNERHKAYYKTHCDEDTKARRRKSARDYAATHKEKRAANQRAYLKRNRDAVNERLRQSYAENKDVYNERSRKYREENKDKIKQINKNYYKENIDKISEYHRSYAQGEGRQKIADYKKAYYEKNKEQIQEYKKQHHIKNRDRDNAKANEYRIKNKESLNAKSVERRKVSAYDRIAHNLRTRIGSVISGRSKGGRLNLLLGCDVLSFIKHLESQFEAGMTMSNYGRGKYCWSIDHIVPLACFNLEDEEDVKRAFHWSNCRPMWVSENASKGSTYNGKKYYRNKSQK